MIATLTLAIVALCLSFIILVFLRSAAIFLLPRRLAGHVFLRRALRKRFGRTEMVSDDIITEAVQRCMELVPPEEGRSKYILRLTQEVTQIARERRPDRLG
jgi:hypothetical protein